jgi:endonuclease III
MFVTEKQLDNIRQRINESEDLDLLQKRALKLVETLSQVNKLVGLYEEKADALKKVNAAYRDIAQSFINIVETAQEVLEQEGNTVMSAAGVNEIIEKAKEVLL